MAYVLKGASRLGDLTPDLRLPNTSSVSCDSSYRLGNPGLGRRPTATRRQRICLAGSTSGTPLQPVRVLSTPLPLCPLASEPACALGSDWWAPNQNYLLLLEQPSESYGRLSLVLSARFLPRQTYWPSVFPGEGPKTFAATPSPYVATGRDLAGKPAAPHPQTFCHLGPLEAASPRSTKGEPAAAAHEHPARKSPSSPPIRRRRTATSPPPAGRLTRARRFQNGASFPLARLAAGTKGRKLAIQ